MEPTPVDVTCAFVICARSAWMVCAIFSSSIIIASSPFARSMHAWVGNGPPVLPPPVPALLPPLPPVVPPLLPPVVPPLPPVVPPLLPPVVPALLPLVPPLLPPVVPALPPLVPPLLPPAPPLLPPAPATPLVPPPLVPAAEVPPVPLRSGPGPHAIESSTGRQTIERRLRITLGEDMSARIGHIGRLGDDRVRQVGGIDRR